MIAICTCRSNHKSNWRQYGRLSLSFVANGLNLVRKSLYISYVRSLFLALESAFLRTPIGFHALHQGCDRLREEFLSRIHCIHLGPQDVKITLRTRQYREQTTQNQYPELRHDSD